jgi:hypothetical protein
VRGGQFQAAAHGARAERGARAISGGPCGGLGFWAVLRWRWRWALRDDAGLTTATWRDHRCAVRGLVGRPGPGLQVLQVRHVVHEVRCMCVMVPALQGANRCLGKRRRAGDDSTMEF